MIEDTENKGYRSVFSPTRWAVTLKSDNKCDTPRRDTGRQAGHCALLVGRQIDVPTTVTIPHTDTAQRTDASSASAAPRWRI